MGCEMPITYIHHKNEQKKKYTQEQIERARKKAEMIRRNDIHGIVELPENIENEYKELDKREISILNNYINKFINNDISYYFGNGYRKQIEINFNEMYNVLFYNKKLENVKEETFYLNSESSAKLLQKIVNCDKSKYKRYNINISLDLEDKKQEIKKVCEKLFLNILTRKYDILKKQYNLDFKLPSREEKNSSDSKLSKKQEIELLKNIIAGNNEVTKEQKQINIDATGNENCINISIDSDKNEVGGIHTTSSIENSDNNIENNEKQEKKECVQTNIHDSCELENKFKGANFALNNTAEQTLN